jgi:hypothetical protein
MTRLTGVPTAFSERKECAVAYVRADAARLLSVIRYRHRSHDR